MKGRQDYESHRPGFAGDAAKQAAKAYRNGTSAATFPAFSLSTRTCSGNGVVCAGQWQPETKRPETPQRSRTQSSRSQKWARLTTNSGNLTSRVQC